MGWYNDQGIVNEGSLYRLIADGLGMYGVEIKSLRADHSTTWKCIVTSATGAKTVTSCLVTVSCNIVLILKIILIIDFFMLNFIYS